MRHLLDFLYEHSLDPLVYCVLPADGGELQLSWRAAAPLHWEVRPANPGPAELVIRANLIAYLSQRGADLVLFERELASLVAAHIVVADQLLGAARRAFGSDGVNTVLSGQQHFARELRQALTSSLSPRLRLVRWKRSSSAG